MGKENDKQPRGQSDAPTSDRYVSNGYASDGYASDGAISDGTPFNGVADHTTIPINTKNAELSTKNSTAVTDKENKTINGDVNKTEGTVNQTLDDFKAYRKGKTHKVNLETSSNSNADIQKQQVGARGEGIDNIDVYRNESEDDLSFVDDDNRAKDDFIDIDASSTNNYTSSAINDTPSDKDHIGFEPVVKAIARMSIHPETKTPLTIGVFGPWGTGKTTFMKLVKNEINRLDKVFENKNTHIHIEFYAWRHQTHEKVWAALLHTVISEIEKSKPLLNVLYSRISFSWSKVDRATKFILFMTIVIFSGIYGASFLENLINPANQAKQSFFLWESLSAFGVILLGGFWKTFGNLFSPLGINLRQIVNGRSFTAKVENVYTFTKDLNSIINKSVGNNGKVILYIDDLDRCSPKSIVEVVEAINIFLDLDKCIFLLGMDHEKVSRSLGFEYSRLDGNEKESDENRLSRYETLGSDFLRKIIQLPINIPPMGKVEIEKYSSYLLPIDTNTASSKAGSIALEEKEEYFETAFSDNLKKNIKEMLLYLAEKNPREIKRFVNRLQFFYLLARIREDFEYNEDNENSLLLWLLIRDRCPDVVKFISLNYPIDTMTWDDLLSGSKGKHDCVEKLFAQLVHDKINDKISGNWVDSYGDKYDQFLLLTNEYFR